MKKNKEKAFDLRRSGKSYKQIQEELNIPIGTLSGWFKNLSWSKKIKDRLSAEISLSNPLSLRLMAEANRKRWKAKHAEYRDLAVKEFGAYKKDPLFMAGIMLYWGKGDQQQKYSSIKLSNSEPEMIRIFYLFLTKRVGIPPDKIRCWLLLYPDLIESVQKNFWSKVTGIPTEKFMKSTYIKGGHPKKRLSYGVCTLRVGSRALKERMLRWIELYQDHLRSRDASLENNGK